MKRGIDMFPEEGAADVQFVRRWVGCNVNDDIIGGLVSPDVEFIGWMRWSEVGR